LNLAERRQIGILHKWRDW